MTHAHWPNRLVYLKRETWSLYINNFASRRSTTSNMIKPTPTTVSVAAKGADETLWLALLGLCVSVKIQLTPPPVFLTQTVVVNRPALYNWSRVDVNNLALFFKHYHLYVTVHTVLWKVGYLAPFWFFLLPFFHICHTYTCQLINQILILDRDNQSKCKNAVF